MLIKKLDISKITIIALNQIVCKIITIIFSDERSETNNSENILRCKETGINESQEEFEVYKLTDFLIKILKIT